MLIACCFLLASSCWDSAVLRDAVDGCGCGAFGPPARASPSPRDAPARIAVLERCIAGRKLAAKHRVFFSLTVITDRIKPQTPSKFFTDNIHCGTHHAPSGRLWISHGISCLSTKATCTTGDRKTWDFPPKTSSHQQTFTSLTSLPSYNELNSLNSCSLPRNTKSSPCYLKADTSSMKHPPSLSQLPQNQGLSLTHPTPGQQHFGGTM